MTGTGGPVAESVLGEPSPGEAVQAPNACLRALSSANLANA